MVITLTSGNPLKLLAKNFTHVQQVGTTPVVVNGKYDTICSVYGPLGQIECIETWIGQANLVTRPTMLSAENLTDFKAFIEPRGLMQLSIVQVCTFRFIRRNHENMLKLLKDETIKSHMPYFQQTTMF